MLSIGIKGEEEVPVTQHNTAAALDSGLLAVFATPAMIALMESTARKSVAPYLEQGHSTVGTSLNVRHVAATPIGMKVRCESELIEVDRKRLLFTVNTYDEAGLIGTGTHERYIIENDRFMEKMRAKLSKNQ